MIQDIIAYLIVALAFGYLIMNILRFLNLAGKRSAKKSKCAGCSSDCEINNLNAINKGTSRNYNQIRIKL